MPRLRPLESITRKILILRNQRVILDSDLAALYGVTTRRLNEQVKRNSARFPADFMFQLTAGEKMEVVANCDHLKSLKFSRTRPYAFTEFGAIQAANVLNSPKAVKLGIHVVRAFVLMREAIDSGKQLEKKFGELETRIAAKLGAHDRAIAAIIKSLRTLMVPPEDRKRPIGFVHPDEGPSP